MSQENVTKTSLLDPELKSLSDQLAALMADPQPGLMTWTHFLGQTLLRLATIRAHTVSATIGINDNVLAKVTPDGWKLFQSQHDELNNFIKDRGGVGLRDDPKRKEVDGWSQWQLWELFSHFGSISMGSPVYIEAIKAI